MQSRKAAGLLFASCPAGQKSDYTAEFSLVNALSKHTSSHIPRKHASRFLEVTAASLRARKNLKPNVSERDDHSINKFTVLHRTAIRRQTAE